MVKLIPFLEINAASATYINPEEIAAIGPIVKIAPIDISLEGEEEFYKFDILFKGQDNWRSYEFESKEAAEAVVISLTYWK